MKNKILLIFTIIGALGLSGTAAYYSIIGLSLMFSGVSTPVIIMGSFLELSKLTMAAFLHLKWKEINKLLKIYLTLSVIILSLITSLGIYGLLSKGFQDTSNINKIQESEINYINLNINNLNNEKTILINENFQTTKLLSDLRISLTDNKTQYKDKTTGEIITVISSSNRKSIQSEIESVNVRKQQIEHNLSQIDSQLHVLNAKLLTQNQSQLENDKLLPLKQISNLFNLPLEKTINIFIIMITVVFDPLAICLVIVSSFLFTIISIKINKKEDFINNKNNEIIEEEEIKNETPDFENPSSPLPPPENNKDQIEELEKKIMTGLVSSRKKKELIKQLNDLKSTQDDDIKTYW
jgi:hypothetical protein